MLRELHPRDPEFVGPYRLRGLLGIGGMGRVYLGVSSGGQLVAVKVIRADLAADSEFRARFRREIAVARKVSSQYTAPVIDAGLEGPEPWLATAYVSGPSLSDAVAEYGPLPVGSVLRLATGLAGGLSAIHAAGVVHRDLKPANVLLADDGPRVIDFGISLGADASALTRTGLVVGSPGFMSPEQAEGREVGPASDIFSLGAVLAFAATGKGPFGAGSTPALVYRVVHSPASLDHVPVELQPLIGRCLAKDPRQRPTARELLGETTVQPEAGWLPEPVTRTFMQLPAALDAPAPVPAVSGPEVSKTATMAQIPTAPAPAPAPAAAPPPREDRRQRRRIGRRLALASVITGVLAASAAGGVALAASGHPSSAAHSGSTVTAPTSTTTSPSARPSTSSARTTTPPASTSAPATTQQTTQQTTQPTMSASASPTPTATASASPTMPTASATPSTSAPGTPAPAGTGTPAGTGSQAPQSPAAQSPAAQASTP